MNKAIDLLTVVFREDLGILKSQAQSIDLYCRTLDMATIMVVINDDEIKIDDIDTSWWGGLRDRVLVIHRDRWQAKYKTSGWVIQQVLKLMASCLSSSRYCLVLDAKTIFVTAVQFDNFFTDLHTLKFGQIRHHPVFEPSRQIVQRLFNIQLPVQLGPGGVPFVIESDMVRDMIQWIESTAGIDFITWFQDQGMLTEFLLYSGWVIKTYGSLDHVAEKHNSFGQVVNVNPAEAPSFDDKFQQMMHAITVSVHRDAWPLLTSAQQSQYRQFLRDRQIILYPEAQ